MVENSPDTVGKRLVRPIPNILSTLRLLLALAFPFCNEQEWLWVIIAGGGSDFLDGRIARYYKIESWLGALLDAIADKLFVFSVLLTFTLAAKFSPWWLPAIIARDLTVTAIALYVMYCRSWASFKAMDVSKSGKVATTSQFFLFGVILLLPSFTPYLLIVTALVSILAAIDYGKQFIIALRDRAQEKTN